MSVVQPGPEPAHGGEDDDERQKRIMAIVCCVILLLLLLLYFIITTLFVDEEISEDTDAPDKARTYGISGLLCHTVVDSYLKFAVPAGCDFFIADVAIAVPAKHPLYTPYMATVNLKNGVYLATDARAVCFVLSH
ncbi:hypothetical protein HPB50_015341 [Hyalomma asiaticum]|uniref:Uncharacterized protein n=1 Tax=Hyalomma asiaticum TaxID=266040 RepID=A0ACB7SWB4_HYAAI|nr:hypothetical protein HPB50_015341 [Hyalomma asiaticum]